MKKSLVLTILAGAACAVPALAQTVDTPVDKATVGRLWANPDGTVTSTPPSGTFSRAVGTVFDGDTASTCAFYLGDRRILEDCSFAPGPWASTTNNLIATIAFPVANSGSLAANYDFRARIWAAADFNANPMVSGAPLVTYGPFAVRALGTGIFIFTLGTPTAPLNLTVPGNIVYIENIVNTVGGTIDQQPPSGGTNPAFLWGVNIAFPPDLGSTTTSWGRDRNNNGILEGGPVGPAPAEHNNTVAAAGACTGQSLMSFHVITGELPANPPATFENIGIDEGLVTRNVNIAAGDVKWYRITTGGIEISDVLARFWDVWSENDAVLALYDNNGNIVRQDTNDGPAESPQLTFGIGRRERIGDGYQFDGRDGQLTADTVYWLGVAGDSAAFGSGWTVTNAPANPVSVAVNFNSNVTSGNLDPSVAPAGPNVTDAGQILDPGFPGTSTTPWQANGVVWTRFEVCGPVTAANGKFLDIDYSQGAGQDQQAYIFNSSGIVVATSDDDNGGLPQFSFGAPGPRGPYIPGFTAFNSEDGDLAAGVYFLGSGFFPVTTLGTNDRWHLRVGGGSTIGIRTDFYTNLLSTDCGGPTCPPCPADFDQNGEIEPIDVRAFFNAFRDENPCADVDGNGELEPIDVRAFFNIFRNPGTDPDCPA